MWLRHKWYYITSGAGACFIFITSNKEIKFSIFREPIVHKAQIRPDENGHTRRQLGLTILKLIVLLISLVTVREQEPWRSCFLSETYLLCSGTFHDTARLLPWRQPVHTWAERWGSMLIILQHWQALSNKAWIGSIPRAHNTRQAGTSYISPLQSQMTREYSSPS